MLALAKIAATEGGVAVQDFAIPSPGPGEVLIKMQAAGICGTDMQIYKWAPRMRSRVQVPRILGHEMAGHVTELGAGVSSVNVGDFVSLESHIFCGVCRQCRSGQAHVCQDLGYPGISIDGGFAEWVVVPEQICWVNPPDMDPYLAAMLEPYGISVYASDVGTGVSGQAVLINGCGPIGMMNVATARALGASQILAVDPNPKRRAMAAQMGADRTLDPYEEDVAKACQDMTKGYGIDVAIEYSGTPAGFEACTASLRKGGEFRLVGAPPDPHAVTFAAWLYKAITVHAIHGRRLWGDWVLGQDLLAAGKVDLSPLVSHVLPLSESPRGFELILAGEALKPILVPD
jgi:threonine 3-dehydrogenase